MVNKNKINNNKNNNNIDNKDNNKDNNKDDNNITNNNIDNNTDNNTIITCKFCGKSHYKKYGFQVINKNINVKNVVGYL